MGFKRNVLNSAMLFTGRTRSDINFDDLDKNFKVTAFRKQQQQQQNFLYIPISFLDCESTEHFWIGCSVHKCFACSIILQAYAEIS